VWFGIAYFVLTVAWQQTTTAMGWHDYSIVESVIYAAVFTAFLLGVQAWWDARRRRDTTTGEHPPA